MCSSHTGCVAGRPRRGVPGTVGRAREGRSGRRHRCVPGEVTACGGPPGREAVVGPWMEPRRGGNGSYPRALGVTAGVSAEEVGSAVRTPPWAASCSHSGESPFLFVPGAWGERPTGRRRDESTERQVTEEQGSTVLRRRGAGPAHRGHGREQVLAIAWLPAWGPWGRFRGHGRTSGCPADAGGGGTGFF